MNLPYYKSRLEASGVLFDKGLTDAEIKHTEEKYEFRFPPDLKEFLMFALPVNRKAVNWREDNKNEVYKALIWAYEGICFDIQHNNFWLDDWGEKPTSLNDAFYIAKKAVDAAPTLIPIFSHRFMPSEPHEYGNPVFSVHQTDIIYYGTNLYNYFENEFSCYFGREGYQLDGEIKHIKFWSYFTEP